MNVGDVIGNMKWLKKPDYGDADSGHQWQTWEAKKPDPRNNKIINSLDVYSSVNDAGDYQIRLIRSTSPTFTTGEKIKVGSTFGDVRKKFPKIAKIAEYQSPQFASKVALFDEQAAGIAFEFKLGLDGQVGRREKCLAIWSHEPGLQILNELYPAPKYLTQRPSIRKQGKRH